MFPCICEGGQHPHRPMPSSMRPWRREKDLGWILRYKRISSYLRGIVAVMCVLYAVMHLFPTNDLLSREHIHNAVDPIPTGTTEPWEGKIPLPCSTHRIADARRDGKTFSREDAITVVQDVML